MADQGRLEQVIINLLINARDAIDAKWEAQPNINDDKRIDIKTSSNEKDITIEVSDSGTGIPGHVSDKIFEPFFTTKKIGKGTGLGLSISYGFIQDCGGSIQVESKKNEGASFIIKLPVINE